MNRDDFQKLTKLRLKEARTLISNKNFDGAYYLSGYAVEFAIKSCIAKKTNRYDYPDLETVKKSHQHNLLNLIQVAGLLRALNAEINSNANFSTKWNVVKDWRETSRYEIHDKQKAKDIYNSIVNRKNGVLRWIKQYW
jgi:HEPN domain-containing protein